MPISPQSLIIRPGMISMTLSDITNIGLLSLMNTNYKAALGVILIVAVFATSVVGNFGKVFAQNVTNQTTNQSASSNPQLTTSDVEDIRKTLENVKKDIADGKSIDALKAINQID